MIYTITLNPAIDCAVSAQNITYGRLNRVDSQNLRFSGKGINVSYVLKEFGVPSTIMGFVAGFMGDALAAGLASDGFPCDFVRLKSGETRINVKLTSSSAEGDPDTEINAPGPVPCEDDLAEFTKKLALLKPGDAAVLAGSLPAGVSDEYVRCIADALPEGVSFLCDLSGKSLRTALSANPDFVKPNIHELFELFEVPVTPETTSDRTLIKECAAKLMDMGAKSALITMGEDGACFITPEGSGFVAPPTIPEEGDDVRSAVGCGDSTVAGWLIGMGFGGDDARDRAFAVTGAKCAAELAVITGSASFAFGFPPSPEKAKLLCT